MALVDFYNQAVQGIVNSGLGSAKEAFDTNAGNINTAYEQAEREQRQRPMTLVHYSLIRTLTLVLM